MAALTTDDITQAEVVAILDPDGVEGIQEAIDAEELDITFGITTAIGLVNQVCLDSGYDYDWLTVIAKWLAAHFVSVPLPKTKQEAAKGLTETSEGQTKLGLDFTRFGQQAKTLDYKGNLAKIDQIPTGRTRVTGSVNYVGGSTDPRKETY